MVKASSGSARHRAARQPAQSKDRAKLNKKDSLKKKDTLNKKDSLKKKDTSIGGRTRSAAKGKGGPIQPKGSGNNALKATGSSRSRTKGAASSAIDPMDKGYGDLLEVHPTKPTNTLSNPYHPRKPIDFMTMTSLGAAGVCPPK